MRIAVILGSTRPGRLGEGVAQWVHGIASTRDDAVFDLVDVAAQDLPLLDERNPPVQGKYEKEHTKRWARLVASYDGFVFVTPEYNHGTSAALKNAIDFLFGEWHDKAAGFVGYGSAGGVRAVEHLRQVVAEVRMADVRPQVELSLFEDFEDGRFTPRGFHEKRLHKVLDDVVSWGRAMRVLRGEEVAAR